MEYATSVFLITGGAGFIGSHLADYLFSMGAKEIRLVDNLKCGSLENIRGLKDKDNVKFYNLDIGTATDSELNSVMEGVDYVFHLAAEKHNQSKDSPEIVIRSNITGTCKLMEAARKNNIKKAVFTSSLYAYGFHSKSPWKETECPHPATVYGMSKLAGENMMAYFKHYFGVEYSVARLFFVYGTRQFAGQGYKSVIMVNFERIIKGENPVIFGDGEQALDYVYIDDVLDALVRLLDPKYNDLTFNIGSGQAITVNELTKAMLKVADSEIKPVPGPADWTNGTIRRADASKAKEILGWRTKTSIEEGLNKVYGWLNNGK